MLILLPLLSIFGNSLIAGVEANLSLGFKVIRLPGHINPANCSVGNTTFAHGATFKLDCKTQCVCENGRHACSTLCPNEQLPAPEDTISCRSPRLVEVPGHCCKMWLCENPTADVYATCHNSSISGNWSACSRTCGLGMATRHTSTHAGCHQLNNLRLCENRRCDQDNKQSNSNSNSNRPLANQRTHSLAKSQLHSKLHHHRRRGREREHLHHMQQEPAHRIRKGHECRSLQRLGPARIRLGDCVSRKLYRPKLCGSCHRGNKCCAPAVSTTIQVEMLCPLNAVDPINYVQKQIQQQRNKDVDDENDDDDEQLQLTEGESRQHKLPTGQRLWDTIALEPIDQEFLQSHQIQIENKFIAVEWILKCECSKNHCNANNNNIVANNSSRQQKQHQQQQQQHYYATNEASNDEHRIRDSIEQEYITKNINNNINNNIKNNNNDDNDVSNDYNTSSEQQPDIIPYPLSVGETSWKAEKLRRQQQHEWQQQQQQQQQQQYWQRT